MNAIILFGSFFLFLAINIPIALVLIVSTVAYALLSTGSVNLTIVPQRVCYGVNQFTLLCLPFFSLAGNIMNHGGITKRLVDFAQAFVGHIKGGLGMVDILVCMMFGTVSGSAVAGTAAIGCLMIPAMKNEGYDTGFTAGLTACASCCCPIIPPSLAFVIYGAAAKVSVGDMFIAGIVPGIIMGVIMMLVVAAMAKKYGFPAEGKTTAKEKWQATKRALPCIGLPVIVVGGIMFGWFTPTEASAAAVLYALLLSVLVYRTVGWKEFWKSLLDSAIDSGSVMLIVGASYLFGWVISNEQWPTKLTNFMLAMNCSVTVKLLLVNLVLLVVGMFMDSAPAIMLVAPILHPALVSLGLDPIQCGMITCLNLTIGLATPPVGVCLYTATNLARCDFKQTVRNALPFLAAMLAALAIVTNVPIVSTFMFKLLGR